LGIGHRCREVVVQAAEPVLGHAGRLVGHTGLLREAAAGLDLVGAAGADEQEGALDELEADLDRRARLVAVVGEGEVDLRAAEHLQMGSAQVVGETALPVTEARAALYYAAAVLTPGATRASMYANVRASRLLEIVEHGLGAPDPENTLLSMMDRIAAF
jgi:hypothetical protein